MRLAKSLNDWLLGKGTDYFIDSECESLYMGYVRWAKKHKPKLHRPSYEYFINEICDALNIGVRVVFDNKFTRTADKTFYEIFDDASYHYYEPECQNTYYKAWLDACDRYFYTPRWETMLNAGEQYDKDNAELKTYFMDKLNKESTDKSLEQHDYRLRFAQKGISESTKAEVDDGC